MATTVSQFAISYPEGFDERQEYEAPLRGYLSGVVVQTEDGSRYRLYFIDPVRLQQTLDDDIKSGRPYYTEPGMIVLPEVTTDSIRRAVEGLRHDGYFKHLKPLGD